jgi:hypothetical protein
MKDSAEIQIVRGFLPVVGMLGSALVAYVYVVNAPDPLARVTSGGAFVIALPLVAATLLARLLAPRRVSRADDADPE